MYDRVMCIALTLAATPTPLPPRLPIVPHPFEFWCGLGAWRARWSSAPPLLSIASPTLLMSLWMRVRGRWCDAPSTGLSVAWGDGGRHG
jgi:hypothetical protein